MLICIINCDIKISGDRKAVNQTSNVPCNEKSLVSNVMYCVICSLSLIETFQ